jgi:phi13 family phage major tail protein
MSTRGIRIGLRDVHYAILTTDDENGVAYAAPVKIAGAIQANINPNPLHEVLFADDGPMETSSTIGDIALELNMAEISAAVKAALLGHDFSDGVLTKKSTDISTSVAIGFKALKSNGNYKFIWLLKGKFSPSTDEYGTKKDTIEFQTPSLEGSFVRRDFDNAYEINGDEDDESFTESATWFTAGTINAS